MVKGKNTMDMVKSWIPIIGVVIALGGGFIKYGEIKTQLKALSEQAGPDLTPLAQQIGEVKKGVNNNQQTITINTEDMLENAGEIKVLQKEIELLKLQIEEIKVSTSNPLSQ